MREEIIRLTAFVGKRRGEARVAESGAGKNGGVNRSTVVGRLALEDSVVLVDEVMEQEGVVTFRSHRVFGFDPRPGVYTLHFFDSDGANPPTRAEGQWEGNTLTLEQQTPFGKVRYTYEFDGSAHRHRTEVSESGASWSTYIEAEYERI